MAVTFTLFTNVLPNTATGIYAGQTFNAYKASRFGSAPSTNTAVPGGGADYGPVADTTGTGVSFTTTTFEQFYIESYDPLDTSNAGSYNIYWTAALYPQLQTNAQPWTSAVEQVSNRSIAATRIAVASNGAVLPQATINVASTSGFPTSGFIAVGSFGTIVAYTGITGTTFTGCTGGSGTLVTNEQVLAAFQNGPQRRLVIVSAVCQVTASGDVAYIDAAATVASGVHASIGRSGVSNWTITGTLNFNASIYFVVDPSGYYGVVKTLGGAGSAALNSWQEMDW